MLTEQAIKEWKLKQQRLKVITNNWKKCENIKFDGEKFDEKDFNQKMGEKTKIILENIGKNKDKNQGVWYPQEYQNNNWEEIQFLANDNYFLSDVREQRAGCFIAKTDTKYKSSEILNAFLEGPTIADCGSTVMAAQYRALEELIGTDEFDRIFDNKIAPFSITNNLWNTTEENNIKKYYTSFNPIYNLYQTIDPNNNKPQIGDVVCIGGVKDYLKKHPAGELQGENVVCVGVNDKQEQLYSIFANINAEPKTLSQIKKILIDGYNLPPSDDDKKHKLYDKSFENNQVSQNEKIGGVINILRPEHARLRYHFTEKDKYQKPWHKTETKELPKAQKEIDYHSNITKICKIPKENEPNTFETYAPDTEDQKEMLSLAKKFANHVINKAETAGFIMTGQPGIGKTHLTHAIIKQVAASGKKVCYLNPDILGGTIDSSGKDISDEQYKQYFEKNDLIVIDDVNIDGSSATGGRALTKILKYVKDHNKAFLVTSNTNINLKEIIRKAKIPVPFGDSFIDDILVKEDLKGVSKRKTWLDDIDTANIKTQGALLDNIIAYNGDKPSGILFESLRFDSGVQKIKDRLGKNEVAKIKVLGEPFDGKKFTKDYFVNDADSYNTFIIKVTDKDSAEQLLNLLTKVHDNASKVFILTPNIDKFNTLIDSVLNDPYSSHSKNKDKLLSRLDALLGDINIQSTKNQQTI